MSLKTKLNLTLDLNVLNHLGIGLYSSTPAVITEILANAWDADATRVDVTVDPEHDKIVIEDDGHGMSRDEVQRKFLTVGYARRDEENGNMSRNGTRHVMGRKGIGKLAMFSLANKIDIYTKSEDEEVVKARVIVSQLQKAIKEKKEYKLDEIDLAQPFKSPHGTKIVLTELANKINKTESYLRPRLARRFSIIGDLANFKVFLNKTPITKKDRGFYKDIQFLWHFDAPTRAELNSLGVKPATISGGSVCEELLDNVINHEAPEMVVSGFVASVDKPAKLKKQDSSINEISIFANGRVFQEDILGEIGNSRVFTNYLVGEIHAEFLDRDEIDRATANREAIKKDDPKYLALQKFVRKRLGQIRDKWDEWRRELGYSQDPESDPAIQEWIDSLPDKRDQKLANRLMVNIANMSLSNDDNENLRQKKLLYKSAVVGFEKLRAKNNLERLEAITDVLSPEFQEIFSSVDDLEETYYHDITNGRLEVIERLESIVANKELEKVAQRYLFEHLWLLDPTWGRVKGSETIELTLTKELRKINPAAESGARIDIAYRTSTGRHAIIELKKPGKTSIDAYALHRQGKKYKDAMTQYLKDHPDLCKTKLRIPGIDIYFVLEKDVISQDEDIRKMFMSLNAEVFTYQGLIGNARKSYEEYLEIHKNTSRIDELLRKLGK